MSNHFKRYSQYLEKFKTEGVPAGLEGFRMEPDTHIESRVAYVVASIEIWGVGESTHETRCRHETNHDGHPKHGHHPHDFLF